VIAILNEIHVHGDKRIRYAVACWSDRRGINAVGVAKMRTPVEPDKNMPDGATRTGALRVALRRIVLGAFAGTATLITLFVAQVVLSIIGVSSDPHGYAIFAGILFATVLTPVALALWLLYRSLRRRSNR
jgi:hypothetical protein